MRRATNFVLRVAIFLAPGLITLYSSRLVTDVPYWDEWIILDLINRMRTGALTLTDLMATFNDHRILFPRLVILAPVAALGHWYIPLENIFNFACACLCLFLWWRIIQKTIRSDLKIIALSFASVMLFSTAHGLNWMMGFQLMWWLPFTCVTVAVWALAVWSRRQMGFVVAIGAAIIASFSIGSGLLFWVAGGLLIFAQIKTNKTFGWANLVIWGLIALACAYFYVNSYKMSSVVKLSAGLIPQMILFGVVILGSPFGILGSWPLCAAFGVLGLVIFGLMAYWLARAFLSTKTVDRHGLITNILPWAGLMSFALLHIAITSMGRANSGPYTAIASHYTMYAILFWVAFMGLVLCWVGAKQPDLSALKMRKIWMSGLATLGFLFAIGYASAYIYGLRDMIQINGYMTAAKEAMLYDPLRIPAEALKDIYPDPVAGQGAVAALYRLGEGPFGIRSSQAQAINTQSVLAALKDFDAPSTYERVVLPKDSFSFDGEPPARLNFDKDTAKFDRESRALIRINVNTGKYLPQKARQTTFLVVNSRRALHIRLPKEDYRIRGNRSVPVYPSFNRDNLQQFIIPVEPGAVSIPLDLEYAPGVERDEVLSVVIYR